MKSFFKIKQTADSEILPNRDSGDEPPIIQDNGQNLISNQQKPALASLKMFIPKNYFN